MVNDLSSAANRQLTATPPSPSDGDGAEATRSIDGALGRVAHRVRSKDGQRYSATGQAAIGNTLALTHGRYSRVGLRKARAKKLEEWRARYRDAKGVINPIVDAHLKQLAALEAGSDRALAWCERTRLPVTNQRHEKAIEAIQAYSDRIGRHLMALTQWSSDNAGASGGKPTSVTFGGRYNPDGTYEQAVPRVVNSGTQFKPGAQLPALPQAPREAPIEAEVLPAVPARAEAQPAPLPTPLETRSEPTIAAARALVREKLEGWV